jgi:hypothetical protein
MMAGEPHRVRTQHTAFYSPVPHLWTKTTDSPCVLEKYSQEGSAIRHPPKYRQDSGNVEMFKRVNIEIIKNPHLFRM